MKSSHGEKVSGRTQKWLKWVLVTSIPLRKLDSFEFPVGFASGCLIDYRGRRFFLSVRHAIDMGSKDWIIDLGYTPGKGTEYYRPKGYNYVSEFTRSSGATASSNPDSESITTRVAFIL